MKTRIYTVSDVTNEPVKSRLVRASNASAARNYVARDQYVVEVASQQELVDLLNEGVKVEVASSTDGDAE